MTLYMHRTNGISYYWLSG